MFCRADIAKRVAATVDHIAEKHAVRGELKWNTIKGHHTAFYLEMYNAIQQLAEKNFIQLKVMLVDTSQVNQSV